MATAENPLKIVGSFFKGRGFPGTRLEGILKRILPCGGRSRGSGTSVIAASLQDLLRQTSIGAEKIEAEISNARTVIEALGRNKKLPLPGLGGFKRLVAGPATNFRLTG